MFIARVASLICFALCAIVTGCRDSVKDEANKPTKLDDLRNQDVLFSINGENYTAGQFRSDVDYRLDLVKYHKGIAADEKVQMLERSISQSVLTKVFATIARRQIALKSGVQVTPEIGSSVELKFAVKFCKGTDSLPDLEQRCFSSVENYRRFREEIETEKVMTAYNQKTLAAAIVVTDEELDAKLKQIVKENQEAQATNAFIYATATNVWRRALAGDDFASLADAFSQEKNMAPGGDLGFCDANDFAGEESEDVWKTLSNLKPGEVTPPFPTIEGLTIFKCFATTNADEGTGLPAWRFSRICFHRALLYPEYGREELRKMLSDNKRRDVIAQANKSFFATANVEFPHGLKIFPSSVRQVVHLFAKLSNAVVEGTRYDEYAANLRKAAAAKRTNSVVRADTKAKAENLINGNEPEGNENDIKK